MSDSEHEDRPPIKVTDRRMFDREGNLREDAPEPEEAPAPPPAAEPPPERPTLVEPTPAPSAVEEPSTQSAPSPGPTPVEENGTDEDRSDRVSEDRLRAAMDADSSSQSGLGAAPGSASELPRDFPSFIESQYYECLLFLGAMRHPATGQTVEDLDMARYKIDLLSMLQEKTEGNRTPEESQMLDDVLYQLRMAYLQKRKVPKL